MFSPHSAHLFHRAQAADHEDGGSWDPGNAVLVLVSQEYKRNNIRCFVFAVWTRRCIDKYIDIYSAVSRGFICWDHRKMSQ